MNDFLSVLASRRLVCDGAMGTQLLARGLAGGDCGMLWNVDRREAVLDVHAAYRRAGCDVMTTNTFGGSAFTLEAHGLAGRMAELNRAGACLAREAAGQSGWVLGDIGPFGGFLEPLGDTTPEVLRALIGAQARVLVEGGADALLVETMSDPAEAETAIAAAKECGGIAVIATYAFQKTGDGAFRTMMGTGVEEAVERAVAAGADAVGANCGTGLALPDYVRLARQLVRAAERTPVILQPNAGAPEVIGGETVYRAAPAEMGAMVEPLFDAGVRMVGGCCGTTPAHLAAMSRAASVL